jgi:hypothetical protein
MRQCSGMSPDERFRSASAEPDLTGRDGAAEVEKVGQRNVRKMSVDRARRRVPLLVSGAQLGESVVDRPGDLRGLQSLRDSAALRSESRGWSPNFQGGWASPSRVGRRGEAAIRRLPAIVDVLTTHSPR